MKTLLIVIVLLLILVGKAEAQKTCTRVTSTSQNCLATVSWTASVVDATHDAPTNYMIRRKDGTGAMTQIGSVAAPVTSFQNSFTDNGNIAHCYEVVATLAAQSSPPSVQTCWTTPSISGAAPAAPVGVSIAAINSSVLRISWDDNNDTEIGYDVYGKASKGNQQYEKLVSLPVDSTTWDWQLRKRYSSYCIEVMALGNPNSPFSQPACATTSK